MPDRRHHLRAVAGNWSDAGGRPTIVLPQTVETGQNFRVVLPQTLWSQGRIVGTFEVGIPVPRRNEILPSEARLLAVLKLIAAVYQASSVWFPVFKRYLATIDGRVRGVGGGNPDLIGPSPTGTVPDEVCRPPPGMLWR